MQRLQTDGEPASKRLVDERRQLLDDGEHLLSLGDVQAARQALDRAAMMLHAPDTEAALVRTQMQAGEYRQALAFAAHAAGAHRREWPAGTALYVWLLRLGGQGVVAQRMLDEALTLAPDDAALLALRAQLLRPWPHVNGPLRAPPLQLAPYSVGELAPPGARAAGTALLLGSGTAALVPTALLQGGGRLQDRLWLRNGLGQTVAASEVSRDEALGLSLLRLAAALPVAHLRLVPRVPFGGAAASMIEFGSADAAAAWPLLRQGFLRASRPTAGRARWALRRQPGRAAARCLTPRGGWPALPWPVPTATTLCCLRPPCWPASAPCWLARCCRLARMPRLAGVAPRWTRSTNGHCARCCRCCCRIGRSCRIPAFRQPGQEDSE